MIAKKETLSVVKIELINGALQKMASGGGRQGGKTNLNQLDGRNTLYCEQYCAPVCEGSEPGIYWGG